MTWDVDTAKLRLGIPADDASKDAALQSALDASLMAAESYCDRRFLLLDDSEEFTLPCGPSLLVRRYPLQSLATLAPLDPQPDPPPDPIAVPGSWRMDRKRGIVFMMSAPPWVSMAPVGSQPPPVNAFYAGGGRAGFVLSYTGGFDPLPADLEMALWMVFDNAWGSTPGWGLPTGAQGSAGTGAVKSFGIDGMKIDYDTGTGAGSLGSGRASAWGLIPANAVGILDFYRAETAVGGA